MFKKFFGSIFNFVASVATVGLIIAVLFAGFVIAGTIFVLLKLLAIAILGIVVAHTLYHFVVATWQDFRRKKRAP